MFSYCAWDGIDRQSFFENAILLSDMKHRSQGHPVKMRNRQPDAGSNPTDQVDTLLQMTPDFLDDFTLVASGRGGPDDVTAACLELSDEGQTHILRMARNDGRSGDILEGVRDIITTIFNGFSTGLVSPRAENRLFHLRMRLTHPCSSRE